MIVVVCCAVYVAHEEVELSRCGIAVTIVCFALLAGKRRRRSENVTLVAWRAVGMAVVEVVHECCVSYQREILAVLGQDPLAGCTLGL